MARTSPLVFNVGIIVMPDTLYREIDRVADRDRGLGIVALFVWTHLGHLGKRVRVPRLQHYCDVADTHPATSTIADLAQSSIAKDSLLIFSS